MNLVRVTPSAADYYRYSDYYTWPGQDFSKEVDAEAESYLHEVSQRLRHQGLSSVNETLLHGQPAGAIMDISNDTPYNLVAMTTHGRSGPGRWLLGSVADRVVRYSGDPVLVVRASAG